MNTLMGYVGSVVVGLVVLFFFVGGIRSCMDPIEANLHKQTPEMRERDSLGLENLRLENEKLRLEIKRLAAEENK